MKRVISLLIIIASLLSLVGCQQEAVAGEELIAAARDAYVALNSARVDIINDDSGESEQIFIFKYDEKDIMTYSYIGKNEDTYIAQFNNGYEQFTEENGKVTVAENKDAEFAAYSREIPYPMADKGLILFYKTAVIAEESYVASNEMATEVVHVYDIAKLADANAPSDMTAFTVKYYFDAEGKLLYFKEITVIGDKTHSYTIYITEQNAVDKVANPVDISAPNDNKLS